MEDNSFYKNFIDKILKEEKWEVWDIYSEKTLYLLDFNRSIEFHEPDELLIISETWWRHDNTLEYFKITGYYTLDSFKTDTIFKLRDDEDDEYETTLNNMKITRISKDCEEELNILWNDKDLKYNMFNGDYKPNTIEEVMFITSIFFALSRFESGNFEEHTKLYKNSDGFSCGSFHALIFKIKEKIEEKLNNPERITNKLDVFFNTGFSQMLEDNDYYKLNKLFR